MNATNSENEKKGLRIARIEARNFIGLREVVITPEGNLTCITGKNGAGKTSILEAIRVGFAGGLAKRHIYKGADAAEILIDLDGLKIHRKITAGGTPTTTVTNTDGFNRPSPQNYLNSLFGELAFNPIDFSFAAPKEQTDLLLRSLKIKYGNDDALADQVVSENYLNNDVFINNYSGLALVDYIEKMRLEERRDLNRDIKADTATLNELKKNLPYNFEPFDQKEFEALTGQIEESEARADKLHGAAFDIRETVSNEMDIIGDLKAQVSKLNYVEVTFTDNFAENLEKAEQYERELEKERSKLDGLREKEKAQREAMKFFRVQTQIDELSERIPNLQKKADDLTVIIDKLRGPIKQKLIKSGKLDVKGLEYIDGSFCVNGVEIEFLSESQKLKLGVEIAKKLNEDFKILCIDGVEKLDPETLAEFSKDVLAGGFQCFMTTCQAGPDIAQNINIKKPE